MSAAETLVAETSGIPGTLIIPRKVWTKAEVARLSFDGLSLELINGDLIDRRMGKNPPHIYWLTVLRIWFMENFGATYVRSEDPIEVSLQDNATSEPEPDLAITTNSIQETRGANPSAATLRLVVEVSDTTFDFDCKIKLELYARAGIREYWVLDVRVPDAPRLMVFREPHEGTYGKKETFAHDSSLEMLDGKRLRLSDLM